MRSRDPRREILCHHSEVDAIVAAHRGTVERRSRIRRENAVAYGIILCAAGYVSFTAYWLLF